MDRKEVVLAWLLRGIEDYFISFAKFDQSFARYNAFFNAVGFEMVGKAYLLALKFNEYGNLPEQEAKQKIEKIARKYSHKLDKLAKKIERSIGGNAFQAIKAKDYDGFTGQQFLDVMEAAYIECRYPMPPNPVHRKFPTGKLKNTFWEPINSSGMHKFCYAFSMEVIASLKRDYRICIPLDRLKEVVNGKAGERFNRLFFGDKMDDLVTDKPAKKGGHTVNKSDLIASIAKSADISKAAAEKALKGTLDAISGSLAKGDSVTLVGFGTFSVTKRAARTGRNPQTGKSIKIKAKKVAKFKAGTKLVEAVK